MASGRCARRARLASEGRGRRSGRARSSLARSSQELRDSESGSRATAPLGPRAVACPAAAVRCARYVRERTAREPTIRAAPSGLDPTRSRVTSRPVKRPTTLATRWSAACIRRAHAYTAAEPLVQAIAARRRRQEQARPDSVRCRRVSSLTGQRRLQRPARRLADHQQCCTRPLYATKLTGAADRRCPADDQVCSRARCEGGDPHVAPRPARRQGAEQVLAQAGRR